MQTLLDTRESTQKTVPPLLIYPQLTYDGNDRNLETAKYYSMSTSNPTYKDYSFSHHGKVYLILEKIFAQFGIAYYLVGVNARELQLYKAGIKPSRATADIDFAVMVSDFQVYNYLFDTLAEHGFAKTSENYRMIYNKTNRIIDLMGG